MSRQGIKYLSSQICTLYGYYQSAEIIDGKIHPVSIENAFREGLIDDIIDEMVEINADFGGDTVFISDGGLEKFKGLALIRRY